MIGMMSCSKDNSVNGGALQTDLYGCPKQPLSISELYSLCGLPARCGQPLVCEGQRACVQGIIDYDNVFDKRHYPQLPYEKFWIKSLDKDTLLEVFVELADSSAVFNTIRQSRGSRNAKATVCAMIRVVDMPIMGDCRRGINLVMDHDSLISIDK